MFSLLFPFLIIFFVIVSLSFLYHTYFLHKCAQMNQIAGLYC